MTISSVSTPFTSKCLQTSCWSRCFSFLSCPRYKINRPRPLLLTASNRLAEGHGSSKPQREVYVLQNMSAKKSKNKTTRTFGDAASLVFSFPEGGVAERVVGTAAWELSGAVLSDPLLVPSCSRSTKRAHQLLQGSSP